VAAVAIEDRAPPGEGRGRIAIGIPDVGGLRDDAERPLLAAAPDDERQPSLDRRRVVPGPVGGEPGPIDRHGLAVQQTSTDVCRLGESIDPLPERREWPPERAMLRLEPDPAEAECRAPARRMVER